MDTKKSTILVVLDGWGLSDQRQGNAIKQAYTPTTDFLTRNYPHLSLQASGISVGLNWGDVGNSEVGHLNLGAGRIVYQNFPRISLAIKDKTFFTNPALLEAVKHSKKNNMPLHIFGLLSDEGVHSHIDHIFALIRLAEDNNVALRIHAFTDGRDTPPKSAINFINKIEKAIEDLPDAKIASVSGRSYAMDRNNDWDLIEKSYKCLLGECEHTAQSAKEAVENAYAKNITDEFIHPTIIAPVQENIIQGGCGIIFFNFREDRMREITDAFVKPNFTNFDRKKLENILLVSFIESEKGSGAKIAFPSQDVSETLAEVISKNGLSQLHIAETEKYAHVTYFFNGGKEEPYENETWHIIPSETDRDYSKHPQMKATEVATFVEKAILDQKYDFILVNFANPDMVGHTGDIDATKQAIEEVDTCLKQILQAGQDINASFIITADHGNAEEMVNPQTGEAITEHSTNPVPCWIVTPDNKSPQSFTDFNYEQSKGILSDVAPTILALMEIKKPAIMTGQTLI
ncbi:2,3-bisphosphoglycerate-independent phosphoglycerate mutase [bacterium]|nr:MAG: 2,3-bisphosphoglycerate-independent phosphoglycerate mutase [bacterium]